MKAMSIIQLFQNWFQKLTTTQKAVFGSVAIALFLTYAIFGPNGLLLKLTSPSEIEAPPAEALLPEINPEETEVSTELSKEKNECYLVDNARKEGISVTASGLQVKVLKAGSGKQPTAKSTVTVHYTGKLINGKVFDSSVGGEPISFPLNRVIAGWTEGLQLMKEGETAELVIPQAMGYGEYGSGSRIPPYQTLVFELELIKVQ